ncbi:hypothetical protein LEP1GSC032_4684 [Leptospira interrogans str. 2002000631]|nr:hypothetical protein [Leptospira interrogans]EMJ55494.1 hypothetical protein LEP1GSC013_3634 [Leptospira interrogans serovar Valbuzzi str. Duyster]EMJ82579.1 hypothetical protein LEP1GSC032_4684 [Leptospira interrogans str. 2002000631]ENO71764.1 hypothetical protein LEP1GSC012_3475 [Leptospira interrogans serovar Valbuzzi str. Valbuzzi]
MEKLESTREDFPDTFLVVLSASADISTGWIYFYLGKPALRRRSIFLKMQLKVIRNILFLTCP